METLLVISARKAVLDHFRWNGGHADVWRVFAEATLSPPSRRGWWSPGVTTASRVSWGSSRVASFSVLLRPCPLASDSWPSGKQWAVPGAKLTTEAEEDYRGLRHSLRMQAVLTRDDRVLLVDDRAERGSQAREARRLVESSGATFLGIALLVDQLDPAVRPALGRVTTLVTADELGDPEG